VQDFGTLASSYKPPGLWEAGGFDYNGVVNILDNGLLASRYNRGDGSPLRPGDDLPPLAEMYVAMLGHPAVY
jgi:hypothetical protein